MSSTSPSKSAKVEKQADSSDIESFREAFKSAKKIIVVAGAGLSAASGIPTFRDGGGLWRNLKAMSLATPQAFDANPSLVWQFYHYRRAKALAALPNPAHKVIAKLCFPKYLNLVAPAAQSFHLITQNIDGLSVQALHAEAKASGLDLPPPESKTIIEMHGRLFDVKCTNETCLNIDHDRSHPLCPALGKADGISKGYIDAGKELLVEILLPREELPACRACGSLGRPGVVWFGESIPGLEEIHDLVDKADMCLVVGTSSVVQPAGSFAYMVKENGGKVAVFNLDEEYGKEHSEEADFVFIGGCETVLPSVFPELA